MENGNDQRLALKSYIQSVNNNATEDQMEAWDKIAYEFQLQENILKKRKYIKQIIFLVTFFCIPTIYIGIKFGIKIQWIILGSYLYTILLNLFSEILSDMVWIKTKKWRF